MNIQAKSDIKLSIIVARSNNNCIGANNELVFHLRSDLQNFKKLTSGKPIIMGRKTFQSLPKLLPNRTHIVVSRDYNLYAEGILLYSTLEPAIAAAKAIAIEKHLDEVFIIGGGDIYKQAQELADTIYLTEVNCQKEGDTFFEITNPDNWKVIETQSFTKSEFDEFDFKIFTMAKQSLAK